MATRITEAEVKEIIDTTLTDEQIRPFIATANAMVDDLCGDLGYGDATIHNIELWLAAHFVAIRDPRVTQEKIGDAGAAYQGKTAMGLEATTYGQQVMVLDYKGAIAAAARAKKPAEIKAIL